MKQSNLTQAELMEHLSYDPESGIFTRKKYRSHKAKVGDVAGWSDTKGYVRIEINHVPYAAHRLAWLYVYGRFPECQIDHIDRNPANNRISNLRTVSNGENQQNIGLKSNNKSGVVGVHWNRECAKWRATIKTDGKLKYLGIFDSIEKAAEARRIAEADLQPIRAHQSTLTQETDA